MRIYLARPFSGFDAHEVREYMNNVGQVLKRAGYEILSPMAKKDFLTGVLRNEGYHDPVASNHAIFERDRWMVTNQADVVLVDLSEASVISIGCVMELAWASLLGKHTVVVMGPDNVHRHAFVIEAADIIFEDLEVALEYLEGLAKTR